MTAKGKPKVTREDTILVRVDFPRHYRLFCALDPEEADKAVIIIRKAIDAAGRASRKGK